MTFELICFFFFQAEDGIRDRDVTGVQTCALPISHRPSVPGRSRTAVVAAVVPPPAPVVVPTGPSYPHSQAEPDHAPLRQVTSDAETRPHCDQRHPAGFCHHPASAGRRTPTPRSNGRLQPTSASATSPSSQ